MNAIACIPSAEYAERTEIDVDGERGYRWAVSQAWYVGPLAGVAAFEHNGTRYVATLHLPLDGVPGPSLSQLLDSITFVK